MGMIEFYSKFVQNFARRTYQIRNLLRKGVPFDWSEACQNEFDATKKALAEAPNLKAFVPGRRTLLT